VGVFLVIEPALSERLQDAVKSLIGKSATTISKGVAKSAALLTTV
jgi:hypothetical protein